MFLWFRGGTGRPLGRKLRDLRCSLARLTDLVLGERKRRFGEVPGDLSELNIPGDLNLRGSVQPTSCPLQHFVVHLP